MRQPTVALLYEHPTWSLDLLEALHVRDVAVSAVDVGVARPAARQHDLWINRVNAMPSGGRPASVVASTAHLLLSLELAGQRIINGSLTHRVGASKAAQAALFARCGLATPAAITIHDPEDALDAAEALGYPVLTKPNVGGSGSGIIRHDSAPRLKDAIARGAVDLGIDGTGLVQSIIESADGLVHRVEMLGNELFYATQQPIQAGAYNYCAADGCAVDGDAIKLFVPAPEIVTGAQHVMALAQADVGGVEFIVDAATGAATFYDFNPYSNFISGYDDVLGFSPTERYLDHILAPLRPLS